MHAGIVVITSMSGFTISERSEGVDSGRRRWSAFGQEQPLATWQEACSFDRNKDKLSIPTCRIVVGKSAEYTHRLKAGNLQHEQ